MDHRITLSDKVKNLDVINKRFKKECSKKYFGISESTLSTIIKNKNQSPKTNRPWPGAKKKNTKTCQYEYLDEARLKYIKGLIDWSFDKNHLKKFSRICFISWTL